MAHFSDSGLNIDLRCGTGVSGIGVDRVLGMLPSLLSLGVLSLPVGHFALGCCRMCGVVLAHAATPTARPAPIMMPWVGCRAHDADQSALRFSLGRRDVGRAGQVGDDRRSHLWLGRMMTGEELIQVSGAAALRATFNKIRQAGARMADAAAALDQGLGGRGQAWGLLGHGSWAEHQDEPNYAGDCQGTQGTRRRVLDPTRGVAIVPFLIWQEEAPASSWVRIQGRFRAAQGARSGIGGVSRSPCARRRFSPLI